MKTLRIVLLLSAAPLALLAGYYLLTPADPAGPAEVRRIRAAYRPKLDDLTLRWRGASPEGKSAVEAEAQPVWEEYRREVLAAHARHGMRPPVMPQEWRGAPLALPWEETPPPN